jgi:hypothetical protein
MGKSITRWTDKVNGNLKGINVGVEFVARVIKDEKVWEKVLLDKYGYGKKGKEEVHTCQLCGKEMPSLRRFMAHRCGGRGRRN